MLHTRRLLTRSESPVATIARNPSYFTSNAHPSPDGIEPQRSSIGRGMGRIPPGTLSRAARGSVVQRLFRNSEIHVMEGVPQLVDPFRKIVVTAARLVRPEGDDFPQRKALRIRQTDGS
jgi:hypothetical protein